MARSVKELDLELARLRADVEFLKSREGAPAADRILPLAGCFTGDPDWAGIHAEIEEQRKQPDAEVAD